MSEQEKYENLKNLQGAVNVNGDKTPITHQPVDQINAANWEDMSFEALADQYTKLQTRISRVQTMGRPDMAKQMLRGLAYLQQLIDTKRPKEDSVTLL